MQISESTDRRSKAQLLGFGKFVDKTNIIEQFLSCKELKSITGNDIFDVINSFFEKSVLPWNYCYVLCIDGAPSIIRKYKSFISLFKISNSVIIITTHCFLRQKALVRFLNVFPKKS